MSKSLRDFKSAKDKRDFLEKELNLKFSDISNFSFSEEEVAGKNIENLIGAVQVPLGVAGPVLIESLESRVQSQEYFVPLATTEGALVASVSRGCKAITESGGARVEVENVGITRGPILKTDGIEHSVKVKKWIGENFKLLAKVCESTSNHLKLIKIESNFAGRNLFIRFYFDTKDAMGMNMATIATQEACILIEKETGAQCVSVAGNFDLDKKPSWLNFISGRGKMVWAEATIPKKIVKEVLKTTPEKIADLVYRKCLIGSAMSGSMGFNAHFANIIAAVFIATGQDTAHVVEGSLGVTTAEILENGDLYFSVYMPSLIVGTVGGGTVLPAQKEALSIMGIKGEEDVIKFSQIVAAAVLAGELSLISSQAEGSLVSAHIKLGRKGENL